MIEIEFYRKDTMEVIPKVQSDNWYFVQNDRVYRDSGETSESQEARVGFGDFIVEARKVGWRIKGSE